MSQPVEQMLRAVTNTDPPKLSHFMTRIVHQYKLPIPPQFTRRARSRRLRVHILYCDKRRLRSITVNKFWAHVTLTNAELSSSSGKAYKAKRQPYGLLNRGAYRAQIQRLYRRHSVDESLTRADRTKGENDRVVRCFPAFSGPRESQPLICDVVPGRA